MIIALLRHGESEANARNLISSNVDDPYHLTELGESQILDLANNVFFEGPIDAIYTSPFVRTKESSKILTEQVIKAPSPVVVDARISEMNFGNYSGKDLLAVDEVVKETFRRAFSGDCVIRMGPTGESRGEFLTRTYGFLLECVEAHSENDHIILVTHSSVISVLEKLWIRLKSPDFKRESTQNGQIKLLEFNKADIKSLHAELEKVRICIEESTNKFMFSRSGANWTFVPAADQYAINVSSAAIVYCNENALFIEEPLVKCESSHFWFAGYLESGLTNAEKSTQTVFATDELLTDGTPPTLNDIHKSIAQYCRQFYVNQATLIR